MLVKCAASAGAVANGLDGGRRAARSQPKPTARACLCCFEQTVLFAPPPSPVTTASLPLMSAGSWIQPSARAADASMAAKAACVGAAGQMMLKQRRRSFFLYDVPKPCSCQGAVYVRARCSVMRLCVGLANKDGRPIYVPRRPSASIDRARRRHSTPQHARAAAPRQRRRQAGARAQPSALLVLGVVSPYRSTSEICYDCFCIAPNSSGCPCCTESHAIAEHKTPDRIKIDPRECCSNNGPAQAGHNRFR